MEKTKSVKSVVRKLSAFEREFTATIADDEDFWHVGTASSKYANKLKKLGWIPTEVTNGGYSFFEVPRRCISFRSLKPRKPSKERIESLLKYPLKSPTSDTVSKNKVNSQNEG